MFKNSRAIAVVVLELVLTQSVLSNAARALEVTRNSSGGLELIGSSCDEVSRQLTQLQSWGDGSGGAGCSASIPQKTAGGCSAEITGCVPKHVIEHHGVHAAHEGPNCFNLVMVSKGVMPYLVKTHADAMATYLKSPVCRKLGKTEAKRAGDVGSIRTGSSLDHGFIYATDKLVYSKNGSDTQNPYELTTLESVYNTYSVGIRLSDDPASECYRSREAHCRETPQLEFYRCKPMDEFLRETPETALKEKAIKATRLFDQIDCRLSKSFMEVDAPIATLKAELDSTATSLKNFLEAEVSSQLKTAHPSPEELFLLGMLKLRIEYLYFSLNETPVGKERIRGVGGLVDASYSVLPALDAR